MLTTTHPCARGPVRAALLGLALLAALFTGGALAPVANAGNDRTTGRPAASQDTDDTDKTKIDGETDTDGRKLR